MSETKTEDAVDHKPSGNERYRDSMKRWIRESVPYDPRFPNTNQTRNCQQNYVDYFRCLKKTNDEDYCNWYKHAYQQICPPDWTSKWDEQREAGIFPVRDCL